MITFIKRKAFWTWALYGVFFLIGGSIGYIIKPPLIIRPKVLRESGYKYINPVLLCNIDIPRSYNEDTNLSTLLKDYVSKNPSNNISIYYLSLSGSGWAGYDMNKSFSPASMLKVPTVVDTLKYSESHPEILKQRFTYDGSFDNNQAEYFKPEKEIVPGKSYTLDDLITYVLDYSDNNALTVLHENINANSLSELYKDLNINIPNDSLDFMSTRTYALFLRVLYNSTYINRENSEKILQLMTYKDFPQGLRSGIPETIDIADKFGERQVFDTNGNLIKKELHDCGIVYDKNPYILCVMTSGQDFNILSKNISDISRLVYDHQTQ